jgi:hypothetical protein
VTMDTRIDELRQKHASLETKIDGEVQRPHPDDSVISHLKKEKLRLKDEIASLERA